MVDSRNVFLLHLQTFLFLVNSSFTIKLSADSSSYGKIEFIFIQILNLHFNSLIQSLSLFLSNISFSLLLIFKANSGEKEIPRASMKKNEAISLSQSMYTDHKILQYPGKYPLGSCIFSVLTAIKPQCYHSAGQLNILHHSHVYFYSGPCK